jgi:outer membrane protein OmpA-like peptidoglycan-associated protein
LIFLLSLALAEPLPWVASAGVHATAVPADASVDPGFGFQGAMSWRASRMLWPGFQAMIDPIPEPTVAGGPSIRLFLPRSPLWMEVLGGVAWKHGIQAQLGGGFGADFLLSKRVGIRVQADWLLVGSQSLAVVSLGGLLQSAPLRPVAPPSYPAPGPLVAPPAAVAPAPAAAAPTSEIQPAGARLWVPHPVCRWIDASEADQYPGATVRVEAPGYLPAELTLPGRLSLRPAPAQGTLMVVAWPGDRLQVGEVELRPGADGVAMLSVPVGPVEVEVTGGGRTETLTAAVSNAQATWVRSHAPSPVDVRFDLASATVGGRRLAHLENLAAMAADWHFDIVGSFSPEGNREQNILLANARAQAVRDMLVLQGIPADHLHLLEAVPPSPGTPPEAARSARVTPRRELP